MRWSCTRPLVRKNDKCWCAPRGVSLVLVWVLLGAPGSAGAQELGSGAGPASTSRPNWVITPSVSISGTYTDNVNLDASKKSDFVTVLTPGITLNGNSSRASANLNYQLGYNRYAQNSAPNTQYRTLAANGKLELVDQWLFVEASQNVAQTATSVFGTQSIGNVLVNSNRSETSGYGISPYIQGRLAGVADYHLRFSGTSARSDSGTLAGPASTTRSWIGRLDGVSTVFPLLGWSLNATDGAATQGTNADTRFRSLTGRLSYRIDPQVSVFVSAGRETNNFSNSAVDQTQSTRRAGLEWAPTERTQFTLMKGQGAIGNVFDYSLSHRTALSAWRFSDSRRVAVPLLGLSRAQAGTNYDLTYQALASSIPDPVARAAATSQTLARSGVAPNAPVYAPIQTTQVYVDQQQQASLALFGANNSVFFSASRSNSEQIGAGSGVVDDFSQSSDIHQSGFNGSWTHNLSPDATLTLSGGVSHTSGSSNPETSLRTLSLLFSTRLGAKASGSVGLRKARFDGSTTAPGYDEQALTGSLSLTF